MTRIVLPLNKDLTDLERRIPDGVLIGVPGKIFADPDDPDSEVIGLVANHPKLAEEDEVLINQAVKRTANTRRGDDAKLAADRARDPEDVTPTERDKLKTAMTKRRQVDIDKIKADRDAANADV